MNEGKYVFSQIMDLVSSTSFQTLFNRHNGEYKVKDFSCWKQFLCMPFGQLTHREILRDTLICLKANACNRYHMGIGEVVAKSTLSKASEIAPLYKHRWLIELFFKRIKQHLKIKSFWGHSENAVKTQV